MKSKGKSSAGKNVLYGYAFGLGIAAVMLAVFSAMICRNLIPIETAGICGTIVFYASSLALMFALKRNTANITLSLIGYLLYGASTIFIGWSFFDGTTKSLFEIMINMAMCIAVFIAFEMVSNRKQKKRIL